MAKERAEIRMAVEQSLRHFLYAESLKVLQTYDRQNKKLPLLLEGEDFLNAVVLQQELQALLGRLSEEPKPKKVKPKPEKETLSPSEAQLLHKERTLWHHQMKLAQTDQERFELARKVLEVHLKIRQYHFDQRQAR